MAGRYRSLYRTSADSSAHHRVVFLTAFSPQADNPGTMTERKRLFLIDGMSNIYRSYYAIRGLSNSKGVPTNATLGFAMMLRKLLTQHHPDYIAVVLDSREKTHRREKYDYYKANRIAMPDDLKLQIPFIERTCEALRVEMVRREKFEADDVIGTLSKQAMVAGVQTVIVSTDKDLCQLVHDPEVLVLRVDKTGETWIDEAGVKERLGVQADQVIDLLSLMGDASDQIPGAPGVGEKGAVQLLEQFGSLENALAGWEEVKKKTYRESLRDNVEIIRQSHELATIERNVPVTLNLEALVAREPDHRLSYELFSELEFSMAREFADGAATSSSEATPKSTEPEAQYSHVSDAGAMQTVAETFLASERVAIALSGKPGALDGIAFSASPGNATYCDLAASNDRKAATAHLNDVLDNGLVEKVIHDYKRAMWLADEAGMRIENVVDDTLLAAYLLDPERTKYELPMLAVEYADSSSQFPEETFGRTSKEADLTGKLGDMLSARIDSMGLGFVYREVELPLVPVLYGMERAGFRVDTDVLKALSIEMEADLERLTAKIHDLAGEEFNINSPAQLGDIFEKLNFEVSRRTSTGKISTSRDILDELALKYELPRLIIEFRELSKLKGTYVDAFPSLIDPKDGRIHTTLNQTVAATGRLSSTDPNLQNIPIRTEMGRRIRRAFVAAPDCVLLSADYSQIELRLLAHVTGDPVMLDAFRNGEDIHATTARSVFGASSEAALKEKRRVAKIVNFGIAYAIGAFGLAQRINISRGEAKKVIDNYYKTYAGVRRYMEELPEKARQEGCIVRSIFGRLRRLPDLENRNGSLRARAEREAINMPMQGSASDIVKIAMLRVDQALRRAKLHARMILQVHDELVFEVPRSEVEKTTKVVKTAMEGAAKIAVPLLVEIGVGDNWMDAKP
jgi:DNA polymerase I